MKVECFQNGWGPLCNMLWNRIFSRGWNWSTYWGMEKGGESKPPWTHGGWKWFGREYGWCKLKNGRLWPNRKNELRNIAPLKIFGSHFQGSKELRIIIWVAKASWSRFPSWNMSFFSSLDNTQYLTSHNFHLFHFTTIF